MNHGVITRRRLICRTVLTLSLCSSITSVTFDAFSAENLIADLESSNLSAWSFSNGPEYPGAKGSLVPISGHRGSAARMTYDLTAGGNYVGADLKLAPAVGADAIMMWMRAPVTALGRIRLTDSSGQTLQYDVVRPLEASFDNNAWFQVLMDVATPTFHYGGAGDGSARPPFQGMGVLATALPTTQKAGFVDFDEVHAFTGLKTTFDPFADPLVPAAADAAKLSPRLAVNVHQTNDDVGLDIARDAGFSAVRLDNLWQHTERERGVYDFSEFDAFVADLAERGMRLHMILDYQNPIYPAVESAGFESETLPAFVAMARATAAHFAGKNVSYEIWNEPNENHFWPDAAGPARFAQLCRAAIAAVHQGDPKAKVATGGLAGFDAQFLQELINNGGADGADAIGVHPYRVSDAESAGQDLLFMREQLAKAFSSPPPVWDTEWGYSSAWHGDGHSAKERRHQAKMVSRSLLTAWSLGFPLIVYYDLRDDGDEPLTNEHNFGLIQRDNQPKPALLAVQTLSTAAKSRELIGLMKTGIATLHALRMDGESDSVIALWSENKNRGTTVTLPKPVRVTDFTGQTLQPKVEGDSVQLLLQESDGPVYLTYAVRSVSPEGAGGTTAMTAGGTGFGGFAPAASGGVVSEVAQGGQLAAVGGALALLGGATAQSGGSLVAGSKPAPEAGSANVSSTTSDQAGCSCSAVPSTGSSAAWLASALAALGLALARRLTPQRERRRLATVRVRAR